MTNRRFAGAACVLMLPVCALAQSPSHTWQLPLGGEPAVGHVTADDVLDFVLPVYGPTLREVQVYSGSAPNTPIVCYSGFGPSPYGERVALADLDNDGRDEIIIGESGYTDAAAGETEPRGRVWIYSGAFPTFPYAAPIEGVTPGQLLGASLAAGNVDPDPNEEFVVGGSGLCGVPGTVMLIDHTGAVVWTYTVGAANACDYFGGVVEIVGDVNGDAHADILVGANEHTTPGTGYALLLSGLDGTLIAQHDGYQLRDHYGAGLAAIDDQDGDGVGDYLIGASQHEIIAQGYVEIFSGQTQELLTTLNGAQPGDYFAATATGLADINGDGRPDYAISSTQYTNAGHGFVSVMTGVGGSVMQVLHAPQDRTEFGTYVVDAGVDDDQRARILVYSSSITDPDGGYVDLFCFDPAQLTPLGDGCGGSSPSVMTVGNGELPIAGTPLVITVDQIQNDAPVLLAIGLSSYFGNVPLPVELTAIGMTGCTIYSAATIVYPLGFSAGSTISTSLPLPQGIGYQFELQAAILDPQANAFGIALSSAWRVGT